MIIIVVLALVLLFLLNPYLDISNTGVILWYYNIRGDRKFIQLYKRGE